MNHNHVKLKLKFNKNSKLDQPHQTNWKKIDLLISHQNQNH